MIAVAAFAATALVMGSYAAAGAAIFIVGMVVTAAARGALKTIGVAALIGGLALVAYSVATHT